MSIRRCCAATASDSTCEANGTWTTGDDPSPLTFVRRCFGLGGWLVPSAILVLLPKCPACLAAYGATGTGVGLSLTTAASLRMVLIALCVAALSYLVVQRGQHFILLVFSGKRALREEAEQRGRESVHCLAI
jgi:hypothetical protein